MPPKSPRSSNIQALPDASRKYRNGADPTMALTRRQMMACGIASSLAAIARGPSATAQTSPHSVPSGGPLPAGFATDRRSQGSRSFDDGYDMGLPPQENSGS
jgi:hypothetical protein